MIRRSWCYSMSGHEEKEEVVSQRTDFHRLGGSTTSDAIIIHDF